MYTIILHNITPIQWRICMCVYQVLNCNEYIYIYEIMNSQKSHRQCHLNKPPLLSSPKSSNLDKVGKKKQKWSHHLSSHKCRPNHCKYEAMQSNTWDVLLDSFLLLLLPLHVNPMGYASSTGLTLSWSEILQISICENSAVVGRAPSNLARGRFTARTRQLRLLVQWLITSPLSIGQFHHFVIITFWQANRQIE